MVYESPIFDVFNHNLNHAKVIRVYHAFTCQEFDWLLLFHVDAGKSWTKNKLVGYKYH